MSAGEGENGQSFFSTGAKENICLPYPLGKLFASLKNPESYELNRMCVDLLGDTKNLFVRYASKKLSIP